MKVAVLSLFLVASLAVSPLAAQQKAHMETPSQAPSQGQESTETDIGWPRQIVSGDNTIIIYQPQIDRCEQNQLEARAAISIGTKASPQPTYGVVWIAARTEVDKEKGLVFLEDVKVTRADIPKKPGETQDYLEVIQGALPLGFKTIALSRLEANLAVTQAEMKVEKLPLKNDAPRIFFSTKPAVLILIDGKPVLRPVPGVKLLRVINTRALIFLDESKGRYYLDMMGRWMEARAVEGPWSLAKDPPASLEKARQALGTAQQEEAAEQPQAIPSEADKSEKPPIPEVYVSTTPAELLQTQGKPEFEPIAGTQLLTVKNTSDHIFMDPSSQDYYVLFSGRWFKSKSLEGGPWEFVPGSKLPVDFAKIPENHPKGEVLSAVPGTPQAREALIANTIPQTATVKRGEAKLTVTYDGEPQFKPIGGTSLQYAVNTATPVIKTDTAGYYAVENGIWFVSNSPTGPWVVADDVPAEIYQIPPSSPVHHVTYVQVYGSTPEVVYEGYTPGYLGTVVSPDNVVYFGTGYPYPPWIGSTWIGFPVTFGFGWGWGWGWGSPWWWRPWWATPWWGRPWWGNPWWWHGWRPWPGWRPWGPHFWPGWCRPGLLCNNIYNHWGRNVIVPPHALRPLHPLPAHKAELKHAMPLHRPEARSLNRVDARRRGDVYAGREGGVYRKRDGKWEKYDSKKGWQPVHPEAARERRQELTSRERPGQEARREQRPQQLLRSPMGRETPAQLNREAMARQHGEMRANALQRAGQSAPRGGAPRSGGGQRR